MKRLVVILVIAAALSLAGCSLCEERTVVMHTTWEVVYPDTTIRYEDNLRLTDRGAPFTESPFVLYVASCQGTNYLKAAGSDGYHLYVKSPAGNPTESTCPIRVVEYHVVEEVPGQ